MSALQEDHFWASAIGSREITADTATDQHHRRRQGTDVQMTEYKPIIAIYTFIKRIYSKVSIRTSMRINVIDITRILVMAMPFFVVILCQLLNRRLIIYKGDIVNLLKCTESYKGMYDTSTISKEVTLS